ncbi:P-loop containing nucleoside triphosphate hydrolase protein [Umbelopsis sp. AD052]|nr:P-loop containing nucleoside triphosphate hydrolase protein [Umbelopsis sp. AD052]
MSNPVLQGKIISTERTKVIVVDISGSGDSEEDADVSTAEDATDPLSFSMLKEKKDGPQVIESQAFQPAILTTPWPDHQLVPNPPSDDDDECRVYVHVEDLARCGVFSSDWVLVSGGNHKRSRLCRIYGVDMDTYDAQPVTEGPPVAKALTVARVASVVSVDKLLQNALLDALKQWFEERTRIVCEGDILAVSLDEDPARLLPQGRDMDDFSHLSLPIPSKPTAMAYFKITRLEEDERKQDDPHPAYFGAGRKISTSYTHMVQTGLELSRVPIGEISRYYGLTRKLPKCQTDIPAYNQIFNLLSSSLHPLAKDLNLSCTVLVQGPRGGGKSTVVKWVAEHVGVHVFEINAFDIVGETDAKTEVYLRAKFEKAMVMSPCVILLRGIEGLARKSAVVETGQEPLISTVLQDCIQNITNAHSVTGYPVMLVATTSDVDNLPTSILGCFRHELVIEAPAEAIRLQMLESLTEKSPLAPDVSLQSLATQTAALVSKDLVDLVGRSGVIAMNRVHKALSETNQKDFVTDRDVEYAGVALTAHDFDAALNQARASYSDSIGAPKIPNVTWDDVGGLANVKDDILDTIQLPLEHPELFGAGMKKRSGILLYGPPGTGKTLLAKAIATSCSLNFFSVKGPELLNMYIGESEANVRRVFQRARDAKPCVIFFDELDSVAPKRGEKGDSGGVMDRIVSQLLAELDGMSEGESGAGDVFVIGATNRPDLLDPALLRPGRFRLHPDLDLARVADQCPFHYTGADFYALCSDAMLKAMTRVAEGIEQKVEEYNASGDHEPSTITAQYYLAHMATPEDIVVQVTEPDFVRALHELIPSVSATELDHYKTVRARFEKKEEDPVEEEPVHEPKPAPSKGKGKGKARVQ